MSHYRFCRDAAEEDRRLQAVERELDPATRCALRGVGVAAGWRCWEVGAGRGSVARWLAVQVGPGGAVLATDLDVTPLMRLAGPVTVAQHDITAGPLPGGEFDLIHARLVLEHLDEPGAVIARVASALRAGGWLLLEDADGLLFEADPPEPVFDRLRGAWEQAAKTVGWHPAYGRRLLRDLDAAGLAPASGYSYCRHAPGGDAWQGAVRGLDRLKSAILSAGLTQAEFDTAVGAFTDPTRMITGAPILIAAGQRKPRASPPPQHQQ